jgi:pyrimidine deaminase RibD-like protein
MKLPDEAQQYYRLACAERLSEIEKWFGPEMERVTADHVSRGLGRSSILNRALTDTIIERWQRLVNLRIECWVETYEQYEIKLEPKDVNDFVEKLNSARQSILTSFIHYDGHDPATHLLNGFERINSQARLTLLLEQERFELKTTRLKSRKKKETTGYTDRQLMKRAIKLARQCVSEPGKVSPKVGALIARDGEILGEAFRGELVPGEHAEYTLFEKKLGDKELVGSTLFTTLEPCTTRNHPKVPCAKRVVERGISKVFIGTLDRNRAIGGKGYFLLEEHRIHVALFDGDLTLKLNEINRDFIRQFKSDGEQSKEVNQQANEVNRPYVYTLGLGGSSNASQITFELSIKNSGGYMARNLRVNWTVYSNDEIIHQSTDGLPVLENQQIHKFSITLIGDYAIKIQAGEMRVDVFPQIIYESIIGKSYYYRQRYTITKQSHYESFGEAESN